MFADVLIRDARIVVGCGPGFDVRERTSIAVRDGVIVEMGACAGVRADTVIVADERLVMPGLVNLHTHLAMTLLRGVAEDVDLQGFLRLVWAEEARVMGPEGVAVGTALGALECLLGGTTTALDMYLHPLAAHEAAAAVGLRHVGGPIYFSGKGPDGLDWPGRLAAGRAWPDELARIGGPHVPIVHMPHGVYTVDEEGLRDVAELAAEQDGHIHIHLAENRSEVTDTLARTGHRPVAALAAGGGLGPTTIAAHAVWLNIHEREAFAASGAAVAHCPGSNLKLASGEADVVAYRHAGIRVGLGTDGCSSSNDLDMFVVMRMTGQLARLLHRDPSVLPAREIVRAATVEGAAALGMADRIGAIEVGMEADLVTLDVARPHLTPMRDPYTALVYSAGRSDVRDVLVAGEPVVLAGAPTRVSAASVMADAHRVVGEFGHGSITAAPPE